MEGPGSPKAVVRVNAMDEIKRLQEALAQERQKNEQLAEQLRQSKEHNVTVVRTRHPSSAYPVTSAARHHSDDVPVPRLGHQADVAHAWAEIPPTNDL